jgi:hypothetical protein
MIDAFRLYDASDAGTDGYPKAWHESIKHDIRELAGDRCVRCKHPYRNGEHGRGEWTPCDGQCQHYLPFRRTDGIELHRVEKKLHSGRLVLAGMLIEAQWRVLTVHHLDGNKLNCRWWNLAALCQRCHLTIQGRVKLERPYFLEHSEWFKPYVAGYYAATKLGEELSREQVMERLDELLGLACHA